MSRRESIDGSGIPKGRRGRASKAAAWINDNCYRGEEPQPHLQSAHFNPTETVRSYGTKDPVIEVPELFSNSSQLARIATWLVQPDIQSFPNLRRVYQQSRIYLFSRSMGERFCDRVGRQEAYESYMKVMGNTAMTFTGVRVVPYTNKEMVQFNLRPDKETTAFIMEEAEYVRRIMRLEQAPFPVVSPIIASIRGTTSSTNVIDFQNDMNRFLGSTPAGQPQLSLASPDFL